MMRVNRSTKVTGDDRVGRDVLDEGAAPAQRNESLIDAAPAAIGNTLEKTSALADTATPVATPARTDAEAGVATAPVETAPAIESGDDLTTIKGIGPKLVTLLASQGITSIAQIAAWSDSDIAEIDPKLGRFQGRIARDQWVEQAKLLISDDKEAYSRKFGNNG